MIYHQFEMDGIISIIYQYKKPTTLTACVHILFNTKMRPFAEFIYVLQDHPMENLIWTHSTIYGQM